MDNSDITRGRMSWSWSWSWPFATMALLIVILLCASRSAGTDGSAAMRMHTIVSRKLLERAGEANRKCSNKDIAIYQGVAELLPDGIPTYRVQIENACLGGCDIAHIHLNCEWFSSVLPINPNTFKRLHYNDCLVNGGKPLTYGATLFFQYANTHSYSLSVSSYRCL